MDLKLSVPLLTPSTKYLEWKMQMIAYMKREDLYEVSIRIGKESHDNENDWINDGDAFFGAIVMSLYSSLRYLTKSVEYPKDLQTKLDKTFGKRNEDHNSILERM